MTNLRSLDFSIEQLINGPAGHTAGLDQVMIAAATWSEPAFVAVILVWFLYGVVRNSHRYRLVAATGLFAAGAALLINLLLSHVCFHHRRSSRIRKSCISQSTMPGTTPSRATTQRVPSASQPC